MSEEHYYNSNFTFSDGFAVAAAVTSYDGESFDIEEERIGTVKFYEKKWGFDGSRGIQFTEIPQRPCKESDFSWREGHDHDHGDEEPMFFKVNL